MSANGSRLGANEKELAETMTTKAKTYLLLGWIACMAIGIAAAALAVR